MKAYVVLAPLVSSLVLGLGLGACAQGSSPLIADADTVEPGRVDASERLVDAFRPDAAPVDAFEPPDAFVPDAVVPDAVMSDAPLIDGGMPDAFVPPPDACVAVNSQLLVNPVFDASPIGTGWQETRIDPSFPLVTNTGNLAPQSAPNKAWLGGVEAGFGSTATDVLYQQLTVPAGTTQLVLTGYYYVATNETSTSTAYDTATLLVTRTDGSTIQAVRSFSNLTATTGWTAFSHTFSQDLSGQTIRVRMSSKNDFLDATSFWFDTLALTATGCP